MANSNSNTKILAGQVKRVVGYAGTFGVLGFFLLPFLPFVAVAGTTAVLIGVGSGVVVAVKTDKTDKKK